jgi:hypothetical protein
MSGVHDKRILRIINVSYDKEIGNKCKEFYDE